MCLEFSDYLCPVCGSFLLFDVTDPEHVFCDTCDYEGRY